MSKLSRTARPLAEIISTSVASMVNRRYTTLKIHEVISDLYGPRTRSITDAAIKYWRDVRTAANNFNMLGGQKAILQIVRSSQSNNPRFAQVGYTFNFYDRSQRKWRTAGHETHVRIGATKQQVFDKILAESREWLEEHYEFRNSIGAFMGNLRTNLRVVTVEGY